MTSRITHERLLEVLEYNPITGIFSRKIVTSKKTKIGQRAGAICGNYRLIGIDGKYYREHILAWFYMKKAWPIRDIDHENRDGLDNKFQNLREATESQNRLNSRAPKNKTGFKGVYKWKNRYFAMITYKNVKKRLGSFTSPEDAARAYDEAAIKADPHFAATNKMLGYL